MEIHAGKSEVRVTQRDQLLTSHVKQQYCSAWFTSNAGTVLVLHIQFLWQCWWWPLVDERLTLVECVNLSRWGNFYNVSWWMTPLRLLCPLVPAPRPRLCLCFLPFKYFIVILRALDCCNHLQLFAPHLPDIVQSIFCQTSFFISWNS